MLYKDFSTSRIQTAAETPTVTQTQSKLSHTHKTELFVTLDLTEKLTARHSQQTRH